MIDLTKPGLLPKVTLTITGIEDKGEKLQWVSVEGSDIKIRVWKAAAAKFATPLTVGATAEAEIEIEEGRGNYGNAAFLKSFGGPNQGQKQGGQKFQPKTIDEIHGPSIAGIVKTAMEGAATLGAPKSADEIAARIGIIAKAGVSAYLEGLGRAKEAK